MLGISAVQALDIPHLYSNASPLSQENTLERKNMSLSIFTQKRSAIMKEIESRIEANDLEIMDFYKLNKRVFEHCQVRKRTLTQRLLH